MLSKDATLQIAMQIAAQARKKRKTMQAKKGLVTANDSDSQWWIFKFKGPRQGFPKIDVL